MGTKYDARTTCASRCVRTVGFRPSSQGVECVTVASTSGKEGRPRGPRSFEGLVRKASRAAHAAVLANRSMMLHPRYGEALAAAVAKEVRDAFR